MLLSWPHIISLILYFSPWHCQEPLLDTVRNLSLTLSGRLNVWHDGESLSRWGKAQEWRHEAWGMRMESSSTAAHTQRTWRGSSENFRPWTRLMMMDWKSCVTMEECWYQWGHCWGYSRRRHLWRCCFRRGCGSRWPSSI